MNILESKKREFQNKIDREHGISFHRNIDLSGYTIHLDDSFISFRLVNTNNINVAIIEYVYMTNKNHLIKLLSFCVKFWAGNNVKFIYCREHKRKANYMLQYFKAAGFSVEESFADKPWKKAWISTNGFKENNIVETYL